MIFPDLLDERLSFPDPEEIEWHGPLAIGGDLSPQRLELAYRSGIFPWYSADDPILWWSPDPRGVFFPKKFHLAKSLKRFLLKSDFLLSSDLAFLKVIKACARIPRPGQDGSWIVPDLIEAYHEIHLQGWAHSIEVWQTDPLWIPDLPKGLRQKSRGRYLVGGLYGVQTGNVFCAESMFSLVSNASKTALAGLIYFSLLSGIELIDCQFVTDHLTSLGAIEISRARYLEYLGRPVREEIGLAWQTGLSPLVPKPDWVKDLAQRLKTRL